MQTRLYIFLTLSLVIDITFSIFFNRIISSVETPILRLNICIEAIMRLLLFIATTYFLAFFSSAQLSGCNAVSCPTDSSGKPQCILSNITAAALGILSFNISLSPQPPIWTLSVADGAKICYYWRRLVGKRIKREVLSLYFLTIDIVNLITRKQRFCTDWLWRLDISMLPNTLIAHARRNHRMLLTRCQRNQDPPIDAKSCRKTM